MEASTQALPGGRVSMCLISRRSRRHPGTRYIGASAALPALPSPSPQLVGVAAACCQALLATLLVLLDLRSPSTLRVQRAA